MSDDSIGFGKPPKASWFKKGHSGNPAGRPKRRTLRGELEEELQVMVIMNDNGKKVQVTKGRAFWKSILARAVTGDMRAAALVAANAGAMPVSDAASNDNIPAAEDREVMEEYRLREAERLRRREQGGEAALAEADDESNG